MKDGGIRCRGCNKIFKTTFEFMIHAQEICNHVHGGVGC